MESTDHLAGGSRGAGRAQPSWVHVGALAEAAGGWQEGRAGGPGHWSGCGGAWPCGGPLPSSFKGPLWEGREEEHCSALPQSTGPFSVKEAAPGAKIFFFLRRMICVTSLSVFLLFS